MAFTELYERREFKRHIVTQGGEWYTGRRYFDGPNAEAVVAADAFYDTEFPGTSGVYAPRCLSYIIRYNRKLPGRAVITLFYKTISTLGGDEDPKPFDPVITTRILRGQSFNFKDLKGNITEGFAADGTTYWKLTKGTTIKNSPKLLVVMKIRLPAKFVRVDRYLKLIGNVNKSKMNLLRAGAGKMLYLGPDMVQRRSQTFVTTKHLYIYSPIKWNDELETTKGEWKVKRIEVIGDNNVATGQFSRQRVFIPSDDAVPREVYLPAQFSIIDVP